MHSTRSSKVRGSRKKTRPVLLTVLTLLMLTLSGSVWLPEDAGALQDGDYTYTVMGNPAFATIIGYTGSGGDIIVPSTLGGYPVTNIGIDAFDYLTIINSIVLPDSIVTIDDQAFMLCTSLKSITFGSGLKTIKAFTFSYCTSLTTVVLPDSVTIIGDSSFAYCSNLTSVTLGSSLATIGMNSFLSCSSLTSITFRSMTSPSIGSFWIQGTNIAIQGHAFAGSNFPAPGNMFYGLPMGSYIIDGGSTPSAPTLTAVAGKEKVDLSWTVPSFVGTGVVMYHLFRDGTEIWSGTVTAYSDIGLVKGVAYDYNVAASNDAGFGLNSTVKNATPFGVPDPPWGLNGIAGNGQAQLDWQMPNYTGPGTLTYHLFRGDVEVWSGTVSSYYDAGLTNGQTYSYYVTASNTAGDSARSGTVIVTPTMLVPSPPTGLIADAGDGKVDLTWQAPISSPLAITGYNVYRGLTAESMTLIAEVSGTIYTDTNVSNGQTYHYKVSAIGGSVESAPTSEKIATPNAASSSSGIDPAILVGVALVALLGVAGIVIYMRRKK